MAIQGGQYNFDTLDTKESPNIGKIHAEVGRQLNERYYQNRSAYINNVSNPINNMQVATRDRELFNSIRDKITEKGNQFKESNDWSQATNYIFNATEDILTNEALKYMQNSYQQEQAYREDLKKSGWDSRMQSAFLLRSQVQSAPISWDEASNTVTGGGWSGIQIGEPADIDKKYKQISDIISKAKASGTEITSVSPDSAVAIGLANALNMDGQTFVSNFLESTYSTEGISYESIAGYAKSVLENDPEYRSYFNTVAENNTFLKKYNPQTGKVDPFTPDDLRDVYNDSYSLLALLGHGLPISDIGALKADGTFELNKNMSEETETALNLMSVGLGFDFRDFLTGKATQLGSAEAAALNNYLNQGFNSYVNGNLQTYLDSLGLKESDDSTPYINQWYQQQISNDLINRTINEYADSAGKLLSYNKTKTIQKVVSNGTTFSAALKAQEKRREKDAEKAAKQAENPAPSFASMADIIATPESSKELLARRNALADNLNKARVSREGLMFTEEEYKQLGIPAGDIKGIENFDIDSWTANNPTFATAENQPLLDRIKEYQHNSMVIRAIENELNFEEANIGKISEAYRNDPSLFKYYGFDTIGESIAKFIYKYDLHSAEDIQEWANDPARTKKELQELGTVSRLTYGSVFDNTAINSALELGINAITRGYKTKHPEGTLSYATKADIVFNPSASTRNYMQSGVAAIATGNGDWSLERTSTGKVNDVALNDPEILKLFTVNGFRTSTTTNAKGTSVNETNSPVSKFEGIDGKALGIKGKIYGVEWNPVFDPSGITENGQRRFKMQATFIGAAGEYLGDAIVGRDIAEPTYNQLLQDNYNEAYRYKLDNPNVIGDDIVAESMGKVATQATQSIFKFGAVNGSESTTYGANVNSLQDRISGQPVGKPVYTNADIVLPLTGLPYGQVQLEITKVGINMGGDTGYKVRIVEKDARGNYIDASAIDLGTGQTIKFPTLSDKGEPVQNIADALLPLTNQILQIGAIIDQANSRK